MEQGGWILLRESTPYLVRHQLGGSMTGYLFHLGGDRGHKARGAHGDLHRRHGGSYGLPHERRDKQKTKLHCRAFGGKTTRLVRSACFASEMGGGGCHIGWPGEPFGHRDEVHTHGY